MTLELICVSVLWFLVIFYSWWVVIICDTMCCQPCNELISSNSNNDNIGQQAVLQPNPNGVECAVKTTNHYCD